MHQGDGDSRELAREFRCLALQDARGVATTAALGLDPGIDVRCGTLSTVALEPGRYDAVVFHHSLEHTNDLALFVAPEPNLKWRTFASVMLDGLQRFELPFVFARASAFA